MCVHRAQTEQAESSTLTINQLQIHIKIDTLKKIRLFSSLFEI